MLTFYQERIANEGYLRTATERQSILQLARAIGYELNPGVAANALLAFTVEDATGAPGFATLRAGVKVSSIPAGNELPQTFETVEEATVRAEWNVLRPRTTAPQTLDVDATEVLLAGVANVIESGDGLLLIDTAGAQHWDFRVVRSVETVPSGGYTRAHVDATARTTRRSASGHVRGPRLPSARGALWPQRPRLPGHAGFGQGGIRRADRHRVAEFQHRARRHRSTWTRCYPRILPDTWTILTGLGGTQLYHIEDVLPASRTDFTLERESVAPRPGPVDRTHRHLACATPFVLAQSEPLPLAEQPIVEPIGGSTIALDRLRRRTPRRATRHARRRDLHRGRHRRLGHQRRRAHDARPGRATCQHVRPATLRINANVVRATHGETVSNEVLGSGQGGTPNQRFTLARPPLTHVSAATATGAQSTLEVRVDGIQWQQVPSLFGAGPRDQIFAVRIEDDGQTEVVFGDGIMGARLSSGNENVTATYRSGIGPAGNVGAGSLALVQARPPGIRTVNNPLAAAGAAAPENLDDARTNAPLTVLTLDRIVSLRDFEDFSRAFAGVGKAQAVQLWDGRAYFAHITVGGVDGGPVDPVATLPNLLAAIERVRDPAHEVLVQSYAARSFGIAAQVLVDPRYATAAVLVAARSALEDAFLFAARSFGQAVSAAEIVTVIQSVAGVQAVSLTRLYGVGGTGSSLTFRRHFYPRLARAGLVRMRCRRSCCLVDPASIALTEMQAVA